MKRRGTTTAAWALLLASLVALPPSCLRESATSVEAPADDPAATPPTAPVRKESDPMPRGEQLGPSCIDNGNGTIMRVKPQFPTGPKKIDD